jgi:hypothetical protein
MKSMRRKMAERMDEVKDLMIRRIKVEAGGRFASSRAK